MRQFAKCLGARSTGILQVHETPLPGLGCEERVHPEPRPQWVAGALGCSEEAGGDLAGEREHADNRFPRRGERNRMSKIGRGGNFGILSSCIQPSSNSFLSRSRALGHLRARMGREGQAPLSPSISGHLFLLDFEEGQVPSCRGCRGRMAAFHVASPPGVDGRPPARAPVTESILGSAPPLSFLLRPPFLAG